MKRVSIASVLTLFAASLSAQSLQSGADTEALLSGHVSVKRSVLLEGVLEGEDLEDLRWRSEPAEIVHIEGHELDCTFSATCNPDGTFDLSTNGCTPSAHFRILKWVIEICTE